MSPKPFKGIFFIVKFDWPNISYYLWPNKLPNKSNYWNQNKGNRQNRQTYRICFIFEFHFLLACIKCMIYYKSNLIDCKWKRHVTVLITCLSSFQNWLKINQFWFWWLFQMEKLPQSQAHHHDIVRLQFYEMALDIAESTVHRQLQQIQNQNWQSLW